MSGLFGIKGKRYVFFSSLENKTFQEPAYKYGPNIDLAQRARTHFGRHLTYKKGNNTTEFELAVEEIKAQLENWIAKEFEAETKYVKFMYNTIKKLSNDSRLSEEEQNKLKQMLPYFPNPTKEEKNWDYPKIISALTAIRTDAEKIRETQEKINEALKRQQEVFKKNPDLLQNEKIEVTLEENGVKKTVSKTLKEWEAQNYTGFREAMLQNNLFPIKETIASRVNHQASAAFSAIISNPQVVGEIKELWASHFNKEGDPKNFTTQLRDYIYKCALDKKYAKYTDLRDEILQLIKDKNISWMTLELPSVEEFVVKTKASIERDVLQKTGKLLYEHLTRILDQNGPNYDPELKEEFINKYGIGVSKRVKSLLLKLQKTTDSKTQTNLRKQIRETMIRAIDKYLAPIGESYKTVRERIEQIHGKEGKEEREQIVENVLTKVKLNTLYDKTIKTIAIKPIQDYDIAEWNMAIKNSISPIISQALSVKGFIPGKKIKLRNDALWSVNFSPLENSKISFKNPKITSLTKMASSLTEDFMREYHATTTNDQTNIEVASEILEKHLKKMATKYQEARKVLAEDQSATKALDDFINSQFYDSISVKDYKFYNVGTGVKGGSLGKDFQAVDAIENIMTMYEKGGITLLDIDLLIEAVINTSESTLIGKDNDIIKNVKHYLLAGAIMGLFDEGFINMEKWQKKIQTMFGENTTGPTFVHLYTLEGRYIPASFLLRSILTGLQELTQDIIQNSPNKMQISSNMNDIVIENNINNEDIPDNNNTMERWESVSQKAQDTTKISILFAAGLLDLFQELEEIFKNPQI